jgi:hypothetical protein
MRNIIDVLSSNLQVQDVRPLIRPSFHQLLKNIAHEYGNYILGEYRVNLSSLSISDKRLVLSHIVDSEDYQWAHKSHSCTESLFKENITYLEQEMSSIEDEVYEEIMEEMGKVKCHYPDNNEVYWGSR